MLGTLSSSDNDSQRDLGKRLNYFGLHSDLKQVIWTRSKHTSGAIKVNYVTEQFQLVSVEMIVKKLRQG